MDNINLFGVEKLTTSSAASLLDKALLCKKDRIILNEAVKSRLEEIAVQALIYTLGCRNNVLQFERVLNPDEDIYGNKNSGIQKQIYPLQLLVENDMQKSSRYVVNEKNVKGESKYLVRFVGAPNNFFIDINMNNGETRFIYPSSGSFTNFPFLSSRLDKENIFSDGPIDFLVMGGYTILPVTKVIELSNIEKNLTYDKEGKHKCKYSMKDLEM